MFVKYVNGCVMGSHSGLPFTFEPLFFCDVSSWHVFLSDIHACLCDSEHGVYKYVFYDDLEPYYLNDDCFPDEPFDYDFDF